MIEAQKEVMNLEGGGSLRGSATNQAQKEVMNLEGGGYPRGSASNDKASIRPKPRRAAQRSRAQRKSGAALPGERNPLAQQPRTLTRQRHVRPLRMIEHQFVRPGAGRLDRRDAIEAH